MSPGLPALFIAEAIGLDFLNSIATPVDVPVDWIADGAGLLAWLDQAQLVPRDALEAIQQRALPGELDNVAAQARDLREWFRSFVRQHQGRALTAAALPALEPLNLLLERDIRYARVVARDAGQESRLDVVRRRRWRSPETLLQPLGEALATVLIEQDFAQVKACAGPACTLLFVDHTRAHTRRWCSMELCGNRAKQAAHRIRVKEQH